MKRPIVTRGEKLMVQCPREIDRNDGVESRVTLVDSESICAHCYFCSIVTINSVSCRWTKLKQQIYDGEIIV